MPTVSVLTPTIRPGGLEPTKLCLESQTYQDFEWLVEVGLPSRGHDLNAAYNKMLRRAQGTYVVSLQDWIYIEDDGIERFVQALDSTEKTFFTAPVGFDVDGNGFDNPDWDWRKHKDGEIAYNEWEIDWAAAPLEALKEIGGFDEELDKYWSSDNVNVAYRAKLAGYTFANLRDNPAYGILHDSFIEHPFRDNYNPDFNNQRMDEFKLGKTISL